MVLSFSVLRHVLVSLSYASPHNLIWTIPGAPSRTYSPVPSTLCPTMSPSPSCPPALRPHNSIQHQRKGLCLPLMWIFSIAAVRRVSLGGNAAGSGCGRARVSCWKDWGKVIRREITHGGAVVDEGGGCDCSVRGEGEGSTSTTRSVQSFVGIRRGSLRVEFSS
eukprot:643699-Rhodomonas_salina.1